MSLNQTLDASINFKSGFFPTSAPSTDADRWNFMNGLWTDGSSMFYGGNGYNAGTTTIPTKIIYPGDSDPTGIATGGTIINDEWWEFNASSGAPNPPGDRRGLMSIAPGHLMAGSMICTDYVFLFNDDDSSSYDNVQNILNIADAVQILYDNSSDFPCGNFIASTPELEPVEFSVFPNPSKGDITVQLANGSDPVIIEVRDMMGRLIHSEISQTASTQLHLNAPAGVYQVVVQSPHSKVAKSLVIQ